MHLATTRYSALCVGILSLLASSCTLAPRHPDIDARVKQIDASRLRSHVEFLTHAGPRSLTDLGNTRRAVAYIATQLRELGYETREEPVGVEVSTDNAKYFFVNVVAELRGVESPERILDLGAHYDSVDESPGADDNASGVAALLEIARIAATVHVRNTIRFVFFAKEESGKEGSSFHVRRIRESDEDVEGAFILEMVGYATDTPESQESPRRIPLLVWPPTVGNFITVVGNFRSGSLGNRFEHAVDTYVPQLPYYSVNRLGGFFKDSSRSDHEAYWNDGYRAIMLTDTANFRNPHYHKPTDTPNTLNYTFMQHVAQATAATALEWAEVVSPAVRAR